MKFLQFNKSFGYVAITVFCIGLLCASYFLIYLPSNQRMVEEQRYRTLQNIDRNIHDKIENSVSLLNNIISDKSEIDLVQYAERYSKDKLILSVTEVTATDKSKTGSNSDSLVNITVDSLTSRVTITLQKTSSSFKGSLTFTFKQFIEYLLPRDVFDEYVIFSKSKTVYESFPSGMRVFKEDSLYSVKSGLSIACMKDISSGGKEYKLFLQPVNFGNDKTWVIGGMLSGARYYSERAQLPARMIMLMIIVVLGMIVIFPCIKLYQMGSKDRLTLFDGASIILVSMILMSLLSLSLFKYNKFLKNDSSVDAGKALASQISASFYNETKKHYRTLSYYDDLISNDSLKHNIINLRKDIVDYDAFTGTTHTLNDNLKTALNAYRDTANVNQVYWLDENGMEIYNWTKDIQNAPHSNFKTRNYFDKIVKKKTFSINEDVNKEYYLDQVVSWTSGTFTSVISKQSSSLKDHVVAMSFTMKSVDSTILPAGYSFAIVDNAGKVLYHSIKAKNLNENVESEFSNSDNVISAINSRADNGFNTRYYSKDYSVYVTPVSNFPYCIIIFSDLNYSDTKDIEVYSFTFSMLILLFVYIVLQLGTTFLLSSRRSFFKKQLFDTSWIGPRTKRNKEYLMSSVFNIVLIIILVIDFSYSSFFQFLFLLLFSIIMVALFFNVLVALLYKRTGRPNNYSYKLRAIWWLVTLACIHTVLAFRILDLAGLIRLIFPELLIIGTGMLIIRFARSDFAFVSNKIKARLKYTYSFSLMVLSGLIVTSFIPIAFFYISSYNYEQKLDIRYRQSEYANRMLEQNRLKFLPISTTGHNSLPPDSIRTYYNNAGLYYDGSFLTELPKPVLPKKIEAIDFISREKERSLALLNAFRILLSGNAAKTDKLSYNGAADSSVLYYPGFFDSRVDSGVFTYRKLSSGEFLNFKSDRLEYEIPGLFTNFFSYWIWLIALLIVSYFLILNVIRKLFCLNLPDLKIWNGLDDKLLGDNELNKLLFVIGLPGAGKKNDILKKLESGQITCIRNVPGQKEGITETLKYNRKKPNDPANNVLLADLINIPAVGSEIENDKEWIKFKAKLFDPRYKLVIFNHFEYNIQDEFSNLAKLNMLEQLMQKSKCKIIILSAIHPVNFLDSINENLKKNEDADKKKAAPDKSTDAPDKQGEASVKSGHDLERWHVLLGHYRIVIMPIEQMSVTESGPRTESERDRKWANNRAAYPLLSSETDYTHFLYDMQRITLEIAKEGINEERNIAVDALALKLQITSHYFYMYIWQSLTKEEKFLLYDLAEDNLVNSYDEFNLTMLLAKGIISNTEGPPRFFNRGFRNFILTAIGNTEAMKIKDRIKENGNWSNLKTPLLIIIVTILAFLLISQQEAYSKVITYVAALSAAVPIVLKIFSLFDKNSSKTGS